MYNKKALNVNLGKFTKSNPYKGDIINDPRGQWAHPGQNTRIPGSDITMNNVPYPVWAQPNVGPGMMMQPGGQYSFPNADYVDEFPQMQIGGGVDPEMINRDKYNTELTPQEQIEFDEWIKLENQKQKRDVLMDKGAYDIQGYWKSGQWKDNTDPNAHGTDTFKKPNHPTFSDESMYVGKENPGGYWGDEGAYYPSHQTSELYGGKDYYDWLFGTEPGRLEHYGGRLLPQMEVTGNRKQIGGSIDPSLLQTAISQVASKDAAGIDGTPDAKITSFNQIYPELRNAVQERYNALMQEQNTTAIPPMQNGGDPTRQAGGEFIEMELSPEEIKDYKSRGYIVEDDLPMAQGGGYNQQAYDDSLSLHNASNYMKSFFQETGENYPRVNSWSGYNPTRYGNIPQIITRSGIQSVSESPFLIGSSPDPGYIKNYRKPVITREMWEAQQIPTLPTRALKQIPQPNIPRELIQRPGEDMTGKVKPPQDVSQWKQTPTGTWYQEQRPVKPQYLESRNVGFAMQNGGPISDLSEEDYSKRMKVYKDAMTGYRHPEKFDRLLSDEERSSFVKNRSTRFPDSWKTGTPNKVYISSSEKDPSNPSEWYDYYPKPERIDLSSKEIGSLPTRPVQQIPNRIQNEIQVQPEKKALVLPGSKSEWKKTPSGTPYQVQRPALGETYDIKTGGYGYQNGGAILISDPEEYAYRNKMYNDSLGLYNLSNKLIRGKYGYPEDYSFPANPKYGRDKKGAKLDYLIKYNSKGINPNTGEPLGKEEYREEVLKSLKRKIKPLGYVHDDIAVPVYKKPVQKVELEQIPQLPTRKLNTIPNNISNEIVEIPKKDLSDTVKTPESTTQWKQTPSGTWYQVERPIKPEYLESREIGFAMQRGGEYIEMELTPAEIRQYRNGGYIVEEYPHGGEHGIINPLDQYTNQSKVFPRPLPQGTGWEEAPKQAPAKKPTALQIKQQKTFDKSFGVTKPGTQEKIEIDAAIVADQAMEGLREKGYSPNELDREKAYRNQIEMTTPYASIPKPDTIKQAPERSSLERFTDIISNPTAAFKYSVSGGGIGNMPRNYNQMLHAGKEAPTFWSPTDKGRASINPGAASFQERFGYGDKGKGSGYNPLTTFNEMANPLKWASNVDQAFGKGDYTEAGLELLGLIPGIKGLKGLKKLKQGIKEIPSASNIAKNIEKYSFSLPPKYPELDNYQDAPQGMWPFRRKAAPSVIDPNLEARQTETYNKALKFAEDWNIDPIKKEAFEKYKKELVDFDRAYLSFFDKNAEKIADKNDRKETAKFFNDMHEYKIANRPKLPAELKEGILDKDVKQKIDEMLTHGGENQFFSSDYIPGEELLNTPNYLVNPSEGHESLKHLPENLQKTVVEKSASALGVNMPEGSFTFRGPSTSPEQIGGVGVHEYGHTVQKVRDWGEITTKYDPEYGYHVPNTDTELGRKFADAMVEPKKLKNSKSSYDYQTWLSSPNELHSELVKARFMVYNDYIKSGFSHKEAIDYLKNPDDKLLDYLIEHRNLDKHFKKSTKKKVKHELLRAMPVVLPAVGIAGAVMSQGESEDKPSILRPVYKNGGLFRYPDGGEIMELTDHEIEQYKKNGYIIEEV